jgi:hypothetical protein
MATIWRDNVDSPALLINAVEDHVHRLVRMSRKFPVTKIVAIHGSLSDVREFWLAKCMAQ